MDNLAPSFFLESFDAITQHFIHYTNYYGVTYFFI